MKKVYVKPAVRAVELADELCLGVVSKPADKQDAGANAMDLDFEEWDE